MFAIRDGMAYARLATTGQSTVDAITVTDVATGTVTRLTTLPAGHVVEYPALAAAHVVWMESWYAKPPTSCGQSVPCNPRAGQPVLWKVVAVPLAGGPETELGTGTSSRTSIEGEGAAPQAPVLAADGDRVAYAIDAPTTGAPDASRLVVRSISTGAILRQIDMTGYVEQLHLAGQAILIGEGFDTAGAGSIAWGDATLLLARSDTTSAVKLDDHVIDSVIGTGLVAWSRADATDYSVRTAPLDTLTPTTIRIPAADVPAVPNPGAAAYGLTVAGPGLAWTISMADTTGVGSPAFVLWQPGAARARLLTGTGQADTLVAGDGLLGWSPYGSAAGTGAVPLATLWGAGG